jgi:hypothetical protein
LAATVSTQQQHLSSKMSIAVPNAVPILLAKSNPNLLPPPPLFCCFIQLFCSKLCYCFAVPASIFAILFPSMTAIHLPSIVNPNANQSAEVDEQQMTGRPRVNGLGWDL